MLATMQQDTEREFPACAAVADEKAGAHAAALRHDLLVVAVLVVIGALLRIDFMRAASFVIDADEAIVGLMAQHIVAGGEVPVFYYGQHYMGSLEAIMVAGLFALCGPSALALQAVPLVCALLLIVVMYALGRECGGRVTGLVAALLASVPPVGLVVWSVKARGGFIEILLIGALSLLISFKWWKGSPRNLSYPALLGMVLGIGFWTNNQILYFIAPIALFSFFYLVQAGWGGRLSPSRCASVVLVGAMSFFLGSAPFWFYNLKNNLISFQMYGSSTGKEVLEHTAGLFSTALPILLGAKHFWELESSYPYSTTVAYIVYGSIFAFFIASRWRQLLGLLRGGVDWTSPIEIAPLVVVFSCWVFVVSTYGWLVQAPRYLLPLYVPLFLLCGYVAALFGRRRRWLAYALTGVLLVLNLLSAYAGGRAVPGEPVVFKGQRVSRDHTEILRTLSALGITKVRTNYWIGYRLAFETAESVTFLMFGAPHQVRLPQYEVGREPTSYNRTPIVAVPAEAAIVRDVLRILGYVYSEATVSGYVLFYDIRETERTRPLLNPWDGVRVSGWGSRDCSAAIDGDGATRWGTGAHQSQGQSFRIDFPTARRVAGLSYDLGAFLHDYPRGLRIEVEGPSGTRRTVLDEVGYERVLFYLRENRGITLFWPSEEIRSLILTQTKSDPVFDWSIAELYLYEPVA